MGTRRAQFGDLRRYSYAYPNDLGRDLAWCLAFDLKLIRDYVRYCFEDERATWRA